jgi:uncharacterized damage-inducible protein DinB
VNYAGWDVAAFLRALDPARLEEIVTVPWFPSPHPPIRLLDTMQQVVLHSQGHRSQNALRLRALGGAGPPDRLHRLDPERPLRPALDRYAGSARPIALIPTARIL